MSFYTLCTVNPSIISIVPNNSVIYLTFPLVSTSSWLFIGPCHSPPTGSQLKAAQGRHWKNGGRWRQMALAPGFAAFAQVKSVSLIAFSANPQCRDCVIRYYSSTVFLHPNANADLNRQKFMAVLVRSTHDFEAMRLTLEKCDGIVIGPGLVGDEASELPRLKNLLNLSPTAAPIIRQEARKDGLSLPQSLAIKENLS